MLCVLRIQCLPTWERDPPGRKTHCYGEHIVLNFYINGGEIRTINIMNGYRVPQSCSSLKEFWIKYRPIYPGISNKAFYNTFSSTYLCESGFLKHKNRLDFGIRPEVQKHQSKH